MKKLLTIATLALLASCGAIDDQCGSDIRMGCNAIFGVKESQDNTSTQQVESEDKSITEIILNGDVSTFTELCEAEHRDEVAKVEACVDGYMDAQEALEGIRDALEDKINKEQEKKSKERKTGNKR